ncbi:MAG: Maf family protein [Candidatus Promineifilaceae bacterium]
MASRLLVLASSSPRRQELIPLLRLPWIIQVADVDEDSVTHADPATNVVETAKLKAASVAGFAPRNALIIGADTTVALDGKMLNKPADEKEAREMLGSLRGRAHQVHTGITVIDAESGRSVVDVCSVVVPMRNYSIAEIDAYIATGDPLDKAGAYAIQHPEFQPVERLEGCYATVVGLPLCHLVRALRNLGTDVSADVPSSCQEHHNYDCPIFDQILNA